MKFKISAKQFMKHITPVADVALKNLIKDENRKYHPFAHKITIEATPEKLTVNSNGGTASSMALIKRCDGYLYEEEGCITIHAEELILALKSFSPYEELVVSIEEDCLKLTLEADKDIYISLAGASKDIPLPHFPSEYEQQVIVDKAYFVKGLEKVAYAQAFEEKMFSYMCLLFESVGNAIRLSAGSGGRFAVVEYESDTKKIASDDMKVIFPKTNITNITRIFKKTACSTIKITSYGRDDINHTPDQIVLESDNIVVCIYGLEHFTKYPDLTNIVNHNYPYQISTHLKNWKCVLGAIEASKHLFGKNIHNTKVVADLEQGYFDVSTKTKMKMNKRIHFSPEVFVTDSKKAETYKPWFACNSSYLQEMISKGESDIVVINFYDQAILDTIPDDKPKQMKPVLLKSPEIIKKDGVKEKSFMFFTVSNK